MNWFIAPQQNHRKLEVFFVAAFFGGGGLGTERCLMEARLLVARLIAIISRL